MQLLPPSPTLAWPFSFGVYLTALISSPGTRGSLTCGFRWTFGFRLLGPCFPLAFGRGPFWGRKITSAGMIIICLLSTAVTASHHHDFTAIAYKFQCCKVAYYYGPRGSSLRRD